MAKPRKLDGFVRAGEGAFMLNQHSDKFGDKRTKRNRSRGDQKRRAISESY